MQSKITDILEIIKIVPDGEETQLVRIDVKTAVGIELSTSKDQKFKAWVDDIKTHLAEIVADENGDGVVSMK